jgi:hypothetical protein
MIAEFHDALRYALYMPGKKNFAPTHGHWGWYQDSRSVNCLKDSLQVALACHLFDQDRGQALRAEFFMNAEEIDFARVKFAMGSRIRLLD